MDNYLMLDGKKYELSPELVNALRSIDPVPEKKNSFERRTDDKGYFYINERGEVNCAVDRHFSVDDCCFDVANYCCDKGLMEQRAMHETLNRLLWRYSETHGDQMLAKQHAIGRAWDDDEFYASFCVSGKQQGTIYFSSHDVAVAAIEEVVKPFMADHPDFVW